jgi:immunity protein, SdpI family
VKVTWKSEALSLVMLATMFGLTAAAWSSAPDRIPVHWGLSGQPDRYGGRFEGLLLLPLMALGLYLLLLFVPRIDPRRGHYDQFSGVYTIVRTALVGFTLALDVFIQFWIRGHQADINVVIPIAAGTVMLVLGNYLPKIKSNWFIGVRTPWTLSSEESWRRTHRLAGWLFVASGALIIGLTLVWPQAGVIALVATVIPSAIISIVYSYFAWRSDPARERGPS